MLFNIKITLGIGLENIRKSNTFQACDTTKLSSISYLSFIIFLVQEYYGESYFPSFESSKGFFFILMQFKHKQNK